MKYEAASLARYSFLFFTQLFAQNRLTLFGKRSGFAKIALIAFFSFSSLSAQEMQIPHFVNAYERLERPDLGQIHRLRFLTTVDFPPFNYLDSSGNLAGYHIDLARAICLELKLVDKCQIEALEWEGLGERLKMGEAEAVIAGLATTAQMRADFAFSRPYMRFPARFVTSQAQDLPILLQQARVGLVKNTAHEKMFAAYFPEYPTTLFDDYATLTLALQEKNLELAFGDGLRFSLWLAAEASHNCCHFVGGAYYGVDYLGQGLRLATSYENKRLIQAFDYALNTLEKQGKLTELYLRYFPIGFY